MTAATTETPAASPPVALPAQVPAEHRGETTIGPAVVEKIAKRAVVEVDGVAGVAKTGMRRVIGGLASEKAKAEVGSQQASVELSLRVRYPHAAGAVAQRARQEVRQRVRQLTGLAVARVDIDVTEIDTEGEHRPRVV